MNKSAYPLLVSLVALVLLSPTIGISYSVVESESELFSNTGLDLARDDPPYSVMLEYDMGDSGEDTLTRNEEITVDYIITNDGENDDTYDLDVSWDDASDYGWHAEPENSTISLSSGEQDKITIIFHSPIQGVGCDESDVCDDMDFEITATSQSDSSVDSDIDQNLEIDTIYAVDIFLREGASKSGDRSTTVDYSAQVKNVGKNTDEFLLYIGDTPKDWNGYVTPSSLTLNPGDFQNVVLTVDIPNSAAVDEYAVIPFIAQVQNADYDYIYGYTNPMTNTSVNDGRTYGVDLTTPDDSKQAIPGGDISYTLSVKNTGDEVDSFELEIENNMEDNWNASLSQYNVYNLDPNEVYNLELTVTSPDDSVEDDWSLCNINVNSMNREQFTDSLETNTSVRIPVRDVALTISESTKAGSPDEFVEYTITLTNTGTDPDDFDLSTEICQGCNAWTVELSTYSIEDLAKDYSAEFQMHVKVPPSALDTDSALMGVTAVSRDDSSATAHVESMTTVKTVYNSEITTDDSYRLLNPGEDTSFNVTVKNMGNSQESFTVRLDSNAPNWNFGNKLPHYTSDLGSYGGSETFVLPVEIPMDTNPGYYNFSINLILDSTGLKVGTLQLSVLIEYYADFSIAITNNHLSGKPGKVHEFEAVIVNNANHEDDIALSIDLGNKASDWSYCFGNSCFNSIKVDKGESKTFKIKVTTNDGDLVNTEGFVFVLTGVSSLNDKVFSEVSLKISTKAVYDLSVVTEVTTKNGNKGSTVPFQFTVTNNGNALDYVRLPIPDVPSGGWVATYSNALSNFELAAKQTKTVYLNVQVPEGKVYGGDNLVSTQVVSDQSEQVLFLNFTVYLKEEPNVEIELSSSPDEVTAGTTGTFRVLVTNKGNTLETVNLSLEGAKASWFTLIKSSVKLEPGSYEEITIDVKPPIAQAAGETSGILNATLVSDPSRTTKITLPLTVLKSDLITDSEPEPEEDNLLPSLSFVSVIVIVSIISLLRRRV
ncbi:MAG: hypothetical protein CMB30_02920 [Euryarchaeota archaeon]|nr:hypothetical protein [Euryarchaeota archaeon]